MKFVDKTAVKRELAKLDKEREQLRKRLSHIRVTTHRLKRLLENS